MPSLRGVRECSLLTNALKLSVDEEFALLFDLNRSKNPNFLYWWNQKFDFENLADDECKTEFRFFKSDTYAMKDVLNILGIM